jgi:hypothetical protein
MKANKIIIILLFIIIELLQNSCVHTYYCFGYNISNKQGISFRLNDTITYISNTNDTILLIVTDFYADSPREIKGFYTTFNCCDGAYYSTNKVNGIYIKEEDTGCSYKISFCEDKIFSPISWHSHVIDDDMSIEQVQNADIAGLIYPQVLFAQDLSRKRRIDKFILLEYHGVLQFHDKQTDLTWTQLIK